MDGACWGRGREREGEREPETGGNERKRPKEGEKREPRLTTSVVREESVQREETRGEEREALWDLVEGCAPLLVLLELPVLPMLPLLFKPRVRTL